MSAIRLFFSTTAVILWGSGFIYVLSDDERWFSHFVAFGLFSIVALMPYYKEGE